MVCFDELCVCLFKASEKMLKAWQENEERAAAFAQVKTFSTNFYHNFNST